MFYYWPTCSNTKHGSWVTSVWNLDFFSFFPPTESTNIDIHCPNQNGTMGEELHLTCIVACKKCNSTHTYDWNISDTDECNNKSARNITTGDIHTFECTIPNASEKHNGTFTLFVQMTSGYNTGAFSVSIEGERTFPLLFYNMYGIPLVYACSAHLLLIILFFCSSWSTYKGA